MPVKVELVDSNADAGEYPEYNVLEVSETEFDANITELDGETEAPSMELNEDDLESEASGDEIEVEEIDDDGVKLESENENSAADAADEADEADKMQLACTFGDNEYTLTDLARTTTIDELFSHLRALVSPIPVHHELVVLFNPLDVCIEEYSLDSRTHGLDDVYTAFESSFPEEQDLVCVVKSRESFREKMNRLMNSSDDEKSHKKRKHSHKKHHTEPESSDSKRSKH